VHEATLVMRDSGRWAGNTDGHSDGLVMLTSCASLPGYPINITDWTDAERSSRYPIRIA
jgi:hypothetical protein